MKQKKFHSLLRQEVINTQNLRFKFAFQKILFQISLLGIGSLGKMDSSNIFNLHYLIYFVPYVTFMFDFYIIGENFGIRRIGNYIKYSSNNDDEQFWEFLLNMPKNVNRDLFADRGNKYVSLISILFSIILLLIFKYIPLEEAPDNRVILFDVAWFLSILIFFFIIWFRYPKKLKERLIAFNQSHIINKNKWKTIISKEEEIFLKFKKYKKIERKILKEYKRDFKK